MPMTFTVSIPRAGSCCRVCSTKTGSLIVAAIYIVLSIVIAALVIYITAVDLSRGRWRFDPNITLPPLVYSTFCLTAASIMIRGIRTSRCRLLLPWIILQVITAMYLPAVMCSIGMCDGYGASIFVFSCTITVHLYFVYVVYCYHEELRITQNGSTESATLPPSIELDVPNLKTCCLAWSTRTGSLCIAVLYMLLAILLASAMIYCIVSGYYWDLVLLLPILGLSLAYLVLCPLMIQGICKDKCHLILPWILLQIILAVYGLGFLVTFRNNRLIWGNGSLVGCCIIPHMYCTFVVYSYYEEIRLKHPPVEADTTEPSSDPLV